MNPETKPELWMPRLTAYDLHFDWVKRPRFLKTRRPVARQLVQM